MAAGDEIDAAAVHSLAASVLARKDVVLAMQVLASRDHALDRAIALAGAVLQDGATSTDAPGAEAEQRAHEPAAEGAPGRRTL